jgi:thiosulfate/3-mercaptopyruvate sulfurtransferase
VNFTALIDVDSLRELLGRARQATEPNVVVLDCRFDLNAPGAGRNAYAAGHIPGAHFVDLNLDLAGPISVDSGRHPLPPPARAARCFASLGIDRETQVIAYDEANGAFAARAWWLLRWLKIPRVAVLDGGFKAWVAQGGAVECGGRVPSCAEAAAVAAATAAPERITPVHAAAVATAADVQSAVQNPARLVIDARAPERFAGTVEPIDPVAGHVPGAVNYPFSDNLTSDGRFLAAAELRRRWQQRLAGTLPENTILMCGSGVTACHNLLAMELAGLPGAKLYAGSWSEWIRDPGRPVAHGDA